MNRTAGIGLSISGLGILLAASALTYWVLAPDSWRFSDRIALGNQDARKIDAYLERTGRLPPTLVDVGETVSEAGPIHYQRCSENRYILWFGTTLGRSMTFDSANRKWVSLNISCPQGAG